MKKTLLSFLLFAICAIVSALDIGAPVSTKMLIEKAVAVVKRDVPKAVDYEVVMLFDVNTPNTLNLLDMLDVMPDNMHFYKKNVRVTAICNNTEKQTIEVLAQYNPNSVSVYCDNEKKEVFTQYAAMEILLPVVFVISDGKVRWKGTPVDLSGVLTRMANGTYSMQKQVMIEVLHSDLQKAIQSGLPDVITATAEKILKIDPTDTLAIQAMLYVLEGKKRPDLAEKFIAKCCEKAPEDCKLRILHLNFLLQSRKIEDFQKELISTEKMYVSTNLSSFVQVLNLAVRQADCITLPLKELRELVDLAADKMSSIPPRYRISFAESASLVCYYAMDLDAAIDFARKAGDSPRATEMLKFYLKLKQMQK